MGDSIRIGVALDDLISGPAKKASAGVKGISTALGRLEDDLKKTDKAMGRVFKKSGTGGGGGGVAAGFGGLFGVGGQFGAKPKLGNAAKIFQGIGRVFGPQIGGGAIRVASAMGRADDALQEVGSSLGGVVRAGVGGLASVAGAAVAAAGAIALIGTGAAYVAGSMAMSFAKAALTAGAFRETSLLSLETLTKSKTAADNVFKSAVRMASITPFQTTDVISAYKSLLGFGFKPAELERTFSAIGDLAAIKGDPTLIQRLSVVLGQIRGKGRLQGDELLQLAEAGLSTADVMDSLGNKLGKTRDEVRKMQEAGKISSEVAIDAILGTIESKFGGGMGKLSKTLTGIISTLVSRPTELFFAAFEKPGGLSKFAEGVKKVAQFLADALDPASESGKRIVGIIDMLGDGLAKVSAELGIANISVYFDKILNYTEKILPALVKAVLGFATGFSAGFAPLARLFGGMDFNPDNPKEFAEALGKIGNALGFIAGALSVVGGILIGVFVVGLALVAATAAVVMGGIVLIGAAVWGVVYAVAALIDLLSGSDLSGKMSRIGEGLTSSAKNTLASLAGGIPGFGGGTVPAGVGASAMMAPGGFGYAGANVPVPSMQAESGSQKRGEGGPKTNTFTLNISGAGLTPDELIARARAEFKGMLAELDL